MRLIIAGSRDFALDIGTIQNLFDLLVPEGFSLPDEVVSGKCSGVDRSGEGWANFQDIPVIPFKPDWDDLEHPEAVVRVRKDGSKYNAAAGPIRNRLMAEYADALLLIWDGTSKGSRNMKLEMTNRRKPVYEVILKKFD